MSPRTTTLSSSIYSTQHSSKLGKEKFTQKQWWILNDHLFNHQILKKYMKKNFISYWHVYVIKNIIKLLFKWKAEVHAKSRIQKWDDSAAISLSKLYDRTDAATK